MHYYQFNIGDYIKSTDYLSIEEDITYRRLIDFYYDKENPIPNDNPWVLRRLRLGSEYSETLEFVLNEFFTLSDEGWLNKRCDSEISKYRAFLDKQKVNGSKGGRPKKPTANPNVTQKKPKQEPLTTNHKPLPKEINAVAWGEFEQHRKEMRQPLSDLARTKAQNIIIDLSFEEQAKVIDKTIQNRWKGLFPEKLNGAGNGTHQNPVRESNHSAVMRRLANRIANE